jgi:hypothetical protein
MSDTVIGLVMIAGGVGMLWSARAYVETRRESQRWTREKWERKRGRPPPWWAMIVWPMGRRTELVFAYGLGVAAIVAGAVVLL